MCWSNYMATPIVLKKPLRVYKVGTSSIFGGFISLHRDFRYRESQTMPTVKINPEFTRCNLFVPGYKPQMWDTFYIHEGYHSYSSVNFVCDSIVEGILGGYVKTIQCGNRKGTFRVDNPLYLATFIIPSGSVYFINEEDVIVSNMIKYTGKYIKL